MESIDPSDAIARSLVAAASDAQLAAIADSVPALLTFIDTEQRYRIVNRAYREWFGIRGDDLLGRTVEEVVGPATYARIREHVAAALAGERRRFEVEVPYRGGAARWVEASYVPRRDTRGRVTGFAAIVADIADRKRLEADRDEALARERQARVDAERASARLERVLAQLPAIVGILRGPDHVLDIVSPAAQAILGGAHVIGRPLAGVLRGIELATSATELLARVRQAYAGETLRTSGVLRARPAGETVFDLTLQPLVDEDGAIEGVVGFAVDVTERARAEARRALLADAGQALAGTVDAAVVVARLLALAVPRLADAIVVALTEDDGEIRAAGARARDAELQRRIEAFLDPRALGSRLLAQVARDGDTLVANRIEEDDLRRLARDDTHLAALRALAPHAVIAVPLRARGRVLGAIGLGTFGLGTLGSGRAFEPEDVAAAEEIGRRAGVVLDHARTHAALEAAREREGFLAEASRILAETLDVDETLHRIARLSVPVLGDDCVVSVLAREGRYRRAAEASSDPEHEAALRRRPRPSEIPRGLEARAIAAPHALPPLAEIAAPDAEAVASEGAGADDDDLAMLRETGASTAMAVPIAHGDRTLAVMRLSMSRSGRRHGDRQRALARELAQRAAVSLENARLYREARESAERAELAQRAMEATIDASPLAVMLLDPDGTVWMWSAAAEHILGLSAADAIGRVLPCVPEDARPAYLERLERVAAGEHLAAFETTRVREDGTRIDAMEWAAPVLGPTRAQCLWIVADVTERKRADRELAANAERLRVLAETSRAFAEASLDPELTHASIVRVATEQLGEIAALDLLSRDGRFLENVALDHVDPGRAERARRALPRAMPVEGSLHGGAVRGRRTMCFDLNDDTGRADGVAPAYLADLRVREVIASPLEVDGRVIGTLVVGREHRPDAAGPLDIALVEEIARRAALLVENARLFRAAQDATRLRDEFLATVSHELRTPLNAMLGWASIGRAKRDDAAMAGRAFETIERNARAQAKLVDDLLDVSRIIGGKLLLELADVDAAAITRAAIDVLRPASEARGVRFEVSVEAEHTRIHADPVRLQQVVWNLASNAAKFSREGGTVRVRIGRRDGDLEIAVEDDGAGIDPAFLPHLFERFRQASPALGRGKGGLGLGLAIVRHLVELHAGTVTACSDGLDRGARFVVRLPATSAPARRETEPSTMPLAGGIDGVHVLLVEDDDDTREALAHALRASGAEVTLAHHGQAGLEAVDRALPDVVVSDIGMPVLDGYGFARALRQRPPARGGALPAIAITAFARPEDAWRAREAGFQVHMPKPLDPAELVRAIAQLAPRRSRPS